MGEGGGEEIVPSYGEARRVGGVVDGVDPAGAAGGHLAPE